MPSIKLDWKVSPPQKKIISSKRKFKIFLGGIGSGKTATGWMFAVKQGLAQANSIGVIVAPSYPLMRDVIWREMDTWLPKSLVSDFNKMEKELTLVNGSVILFRTANDPRAIERLRGMSIAWFWVDEITLLPRAVWDILIGRIRQKGMQYSGLLTGTPKMCWLKDLIDEHAEDEEYEIVQKVPTYSNVFLSQDYIATLEQQYSGQWYRQEILGEFVNFEGLIYEIDGIIRIENVKPQHLQRVFYGVDFGFKNPTALTVFGYYNGAFYQVDEFYQRKVTDDELADVIKQKADYWGVGKVYCDPSAPASIDKLRREGINAVKADNDVLGGIRQVRSLMDTGKLYISPRCTNTINELRQYVWSDSETREQPVKMNDHAADAMRYALATEAIKKKPKYAAVLR